MSIDSIEDKDINEISGKHEIIYQYNSRNNYQSVGDTSKRSSGNIIEKNIKDFVSASPTTNRRQKQSVTSY